MPLWNYADDRREVRNRRSKAVARTRRRALSPLLEGLELRALLSTGQGVGPQALPAVAAANAKYVPNQVLVQYKPEAGEVERARTRGRSDAVLSELIHTNPMRDAKRGVIELVSVGPGRSVEATIQALKADPAVEFAEPNWIYTTQATTDPYYTNGSLWGMYGDTSSPANQFGSQAGEAWLDDTSSLPDVYVGIIDEGIQFTHPDLDANVWTNRYDVADGLDNDVNGYVDDTHGWDFDGNNNTIYDGTADDHGTHVAGTIGAERNNGAGVVGVHPNVIYISAKFLGATGGTTANAIKAVDYFTDLKRIQGLNIVATNNSWGGGGFSQGLFDAISRANAADILFVAAAGNNSNNNDASLSYPASYDLPNIIAVAALASDGSLASYSNYGSKSVDIAAPGSGIYSTLPFDTYGSYNGTSMATPHVTGAAALYAATHPGATGAQIREALLGSAVPTASVAGKTVTGGRLNVAAALVYTPPTAPPASPTAPPAPPSGLAASAVGPNEVTLTWFDKSSDEAGFKIEQSTDNVNFTPVTTTGANATQFSVTGLNSDTTYYFRVYAYNAIGSSGFSNVASVPTPPATVYTYTEVFTDNFNDNRINSRWSFPNVPTNAIARWAEKGGVMKQSSTSDALERKALVTGTEAATKVTAKVRVDTWVDGEFARAGVVLFGKYNLVFTGNVFGSKRVEFLYDGVTWSGRDNQAGAAGFRLFEWKVGTWYQFEMKIEDGMLIGEVLELNTAGVATGVKASLTFDLKSHPAWNLTGGLAGINGSSGGRDGLDPGRSYAIVSFDDVIVSKGVAAAGGLVAASAPEASAAGVTALSQAYPSLPTLSVDAVLPGAEDGADEATPQFVESYLEPVDPTSNSWVDSLLAQLKGRRSRLLRRN